MTLDVAQLLVDYYNEINGKDDVDHILMRMKLQRVLWQHGYYMTWDAIEFVMKLTKA